MKKQILVAMIATMSFSAGALALSAAQKITAELRPDVKIAINSKYEALKDANGNLVYPISYQGSTYLPIRAIGNLTGQEVVWDSNTKTVFLNSNTSTVQPTLTPPIEPNVVIIPPTSQSDISSYTTKINTFESTQASLKTQINSWTPTSNREKEYTNLNSKLDALDYEIDILDNQLELDYNRGVIDSNSYISLDRKLSNIDKQLDALEKILDNKYNNSRPVIAPSPTPNPSPAPNTSNTASNNTTLKGFKNRANALVSEVNKLVPAGTYQARINQYRNLDYKIESLNREMDRYEDQIESEYRLGKITYNTYLSLDRELDSIEYIIDDLDDRLEYKLGIDD